MFQQKFVIETDPTSFGSAVNALLDQGWYVVAHSVGGMFAPDRKTQYQLMLWATLEREVVQP